MSVSLPGQGGGQMREGAGQAYVCPTKKAAAFARKQPPKLRSEPISRVLSAPKFPPGRPHHLSRPVVADGLQRPTREPERAARCRWPEGHRRVRLFGLATPEVYPAGVVTQPLVRSYRTFSPLPLRAVIFCGTGCPGPIGQSYPLGSRAPCVARTFLPARICVGRGGGVAHCGGKGRARTVGTGTGRNGLFKVGPLKNE